jgi:hypothetical protein
MWKMPGPVAEATAFLGPKNVVGTSSGDAGICGMDLKLWNAK